ncbi:S9 family peptidase [Halocatena halophila]|uniref:S9 family peptidase n=1 Tax=Halocatena halophila TaxID=2814576 RepID=UPI002ED14AE0
MTQSALDIFSSLPSFAAPTVLPEEEAIAYWWSVDDTVSLRIHDLSQDTINIIPLDRHSLTLEGEEPLHWIGDGFLIQSDPNVYFCECDGSVETVSFGAPETYTYIIDIDSKTHRVLYTHYDDPWTLRLSEADGKQSKVLTEHPEQSGHAGFSPDRQWLAYRENPTESFGAGRIVITDRAGEQVKTVNIGEASARTRLRGWHPDSQRLLIDDRSTGWYRVGLHDWQVEDTTWFGDGEYNEYPLTITSAGSQLITVRSHAGRRSAIVYSIHNPADGCQFDLPEGVVDRTPVQPPGMTFASDMVYLVHETGTCPPQLLQYDLETDTITVLIDTATSALTACSLVEPAHVTYDAPDGQSINAILHRASETPSPAVVVVHGGPTTAVTCGFDPFAQYLVSEGYTVLQPNYRGSTDQDRGFERAIKGDLGRGEVDDVAAGGQWLAEQPWVDDNRLAVFGHSHGAYNAALQAVSYPELWRVVIPENGYLDAVAVFNEPNLYAQRRIIDNQTCETTKAYLQSVSPIHRTADVGCPVCIIQGEDDATDQARAFADGLRERGWTAGEQFRLEIIEGEGHVIQNKAQLWGLITDILEIYVGCY